MNASHEQPDDISPPLWEVVPLAHYARPGRPAVEAVRKGLLGLFRRKERDNSAEPFLAEEDLDPLPVDLLDKVAPWPDWQQMVPALNRVLHTFDAPDQDARRIQAMIGAPYSGIRETLRCWAQQRQWSVVEPPPAERILACDETWFETIAAEDGPPLIIVELEHFVFRHPLGLAFVRRLLDQLHSSPRACLIAANSWVWTYLQAAIGIGDQLAEPLTFQAFDATRLEQWFRNLQQFGEPVAFCRADDESPVLSAAPAQTEDNSATGRSAAGTDFTRRLAGYSHGIAGVAWAIWRQSLGIAATPDAKNRVQKSHDDQRERCIYVRPWSRIPFRALPANTDLPGLLLLHALLIHGGLEGGMVPEVLPHLRGSGQGALRKLAARGIVEHHQGRWQVTPLGYPATREALESEGLFVDIL